MVRNRYESLAQARTDPIKTVISGQCEELEADASLDSLIYTVVTWSDDDHGVICFWVI